MRRTTLAYLVLAAGMVVGLWFNYHNSQVIKNNRHESIVIACLQQNDRHDNTLDQLDQLIDRLPNGPRKRRAMQNRQSTVLLINALVPKYDCEQRADRLTNP